MKEQEPPVLEKTKPETPKNEPAQQADLENQPVERDIDLSAIFLDEEIDLNSLFPDLEMKRFLKKIKRNKKDLQEMTQGFDEEAGIIEP